MGDAVDAVGAVGAVDAAYSRRVDAGHEVERTADGRYLVIGGRRWRASDPAIPDALRIQLVAELMTARRLVRSDGDAARPRVHDAKVALGERGEPWWEEPSSAGLRRRIGATIRTLLRHRDGTICPSEAARVVGGDRWRDVMAVVRDVATELAATGVVEIRQGGARVDPAQASGPVRISRGPAWPVDPR